MLTNIRQTASRMTFRIYTGKPKTFPVYIFHHVPKCGGTTTLVGLRQWFRLVYDYRRGWSDKYPAPIALEHLRSIHCLCGHFDHDPIYLNQRYPGLLEDPRYRVFTFIRDPLEAKMSLFYYETKMGQWKGGLEEFLFQRPNYLASCLNFSEDDFAGKLGKYFFVGTIENYQRDFDQLALIIGKPKVVISRKNRTKESKKRSVSDRIVESFQEQNKLDYRLYEFAAALSERRHLVEDNHD